MTLPVPSASVSGAGHPQVPTCLRGTQEGANLRTSTHGNDSVTGCRGSSVDSPGWGHRRVWPSSKNSEHAGNLEGRGRVELEQDSGEHAGMASGQCHSRPGRPQESARTGEQVEA